MGGLDVDEAKAKESAASDSKNTKLLWHFAVILHSPLHPGILHSSIFLLQLIARDHLLRGDSREKVREVVASSPDLIAHYMSCRSHNAFKSQTCCFDSIIKAEMQRALEEAAGANSKASGQKGQAMHDLT